MASRELEIVIYVFLAVLIVLLVGFWAYGQIIFAAICLFFLGLLIFIDGYHSEKQIEEDKKVVLEETRKAIAEEIQSLPKTELEPIQNSLDNLSTTLQELKNSPSINEAEMKTIARNISDLSRQYRVLLNCLYTVTQCLDKLPQATAIDEVKEAITGLSEELKTVNTDIQNPSSIETPAQNLLQDIISNLQEQADNLQNRFQNTFDEISNNQFNLNLDEFKKDVHKTMELIEILLHSKSS